MKARVMKYWEALRAGYWFIPSLMTVFAIGLSFFTIAMDRYYGPQWLEQFGWIEPNKPDGARELLSTVAGSMITVAGVTFSITIASISLASQQFGPRLLTNFMRDRGNQVVLGTFVATFLYCLLVLRTIFDGEDDFFVPQISVSVALVLTLANLGVLIYFIHHITESLQAATVISNVGAQIHRRIERMFPTRIGHGQGCQAGPQITHDELKARLDAQARQAFALQGGYVQTVDAEGLVRLAKSCDVVIELLRRPGDFVIVGDSLARIWPPQRLDEALERRLNRLIALNWQRTPNQDILYLINELVEMSARALSTGINDPFTVISCVDRLAAAFVDLMQREWPSPARFDDKNTLRVIAYPVSFEDFAEAAFGQLRPYVSTDRNAALHLLTVLCHIASRTDSTVQRDTLLLHAERLAEACGEGLALEDSRREVRDAHLRLRRAVLHETSAS
ncbi:MAG: DUF2254 domain-containing protein [Bradymonadaceae bacterium]|nr:DUF2254 domain-containing protein [Lujinxingiaceae bacterium]